MQFQMVPSARHFFHEAKPFERLTQLNLPIKLLTVSSKIDLTNGFSRMLLVPPVFVCLYYESQIALLGKLKGLLQSIKESHDSAFWNLPGQGLAELIISISA